MVTFWEHGYEGTSIGELTAAMGIHPPSLYAAFGSKEELFREAVALYQEREGGPAFRAMDEAPTAREGIEALLRTVAHAYTDPDKPAGCMIVLAATTYTPSSKGVRDFLAEQRRRSTAAVRDRLARGQADGDVPLNADIDTLAAYVSSVQFGMSMMARDGVPRDRLLEVVDMTLAAWDHLVGARVATR